MVINNSQMICGLFFVGQCLILKYVDTKKCLYEVQNYKSGQDEDCPRV